MMISNLNLAKLPECVCEMRYIDSALLTPCAEYQRVLRTRKVEEISATFSEYVANEPRVSYRDGRYHVFDGQNTIEARIACNGGHDLPILCKVFHGLSKKDEALLFAVQTGISTDLTAGERLVLTLWQKMRMPVHLLPPPKQLVLLLHWMASGPSGRSTASVLPIIFTRTMVLTSIRKP